MNRFENIKHGVTDHILDMQPKYKFKDEVCIIYHKHSAITSDEVCNALNMAHELKQLPRTATKKQMLEIITKFS